MKQYFFTFLTSFFLFAVLTVMCCTVQQVDQIEIKPSLTKSKVLVGKSVSMLIPLAYTRVDDSDTFRTADKASFLAVNLSEKHMSDLRVNYAPAALELEGLTLSQLSTVRYGSNEDAFFAKTYNAKTSIFQYALVIQQRGKTYLLEAACRDISHDFYDYKIRQSLLSTYID